MGRDRLALLPKGSSRKPGKKLCGEGKRKLLGLRLQGSQLKWPLQQSLQSRWNHKTAFCHLPLQGSPKCNLLRTPTTKAAQWCLWPIRKATYGLSREQQLPHLQQHGMARWGALQQHGMARWGALQQTPGKINNFCTARPTAFENRGFARQIDICRHAHWTLPGFCSFPQALWKSTFLLRT